MKHISILPLYDATLTSIDSAHQIFSRVNDFMKYQGKPQFYQVDIVGMEKHIKMNGGLYAITADKTIAEVTKTDVIIIPLLCGDFEEAIQKNMGYNHWLTAQYQNKAEIVCLCVGSFFFGGNRLVDR
jgi:transcriptional regulator GlxA family with amidase domain